MGKVFDLSLFAISSAQRTVRCSVHGHFSRQGAAAMRWHTFRPQLEVLENRLTPSGGNPQTVLPNPGNPQAVNSDNLVAIFSAQVIHNGSAPTLGADAAHGARGAEIQLLLGH
jgi:hypothetical protein